MRGGLRGIREVLSVAGGLIVYVLGGYDSILELMLIAMSLDFLSGFLKAIYFDKRDNDKCYKGLARKSGMLMLLGVITVIDRQQVAGGMIRSWYIYAVTLNEAASCTENLGQMRVPLAKQVYDLIEKFKEKNNLKG